SPGVGGALSLREGRGLCHDSAQLDALWVEPRESPEHGGAPESAAISEVRRAHERDCEEKNSREERDHPPTRPARGLPKRPAQRPESPGPRPIGAYRGPTPAPPTRAPGTKRTHWREARARSTESGARSRRREHGRRSKRRPPR